MSVVFSFVHVSALYNSLLSGHALANLIPISILLCFNSFELATASISLQTPAASEILLSTVVVSVPLSFIYSLRNLYSLTLCICLPLILSSSALLFLFPVFIKY